MVSRGRHGPARRPSRDDDGAHDGDAAAGETGHGTGRGTRIGLAAAWVLIAAMTVFLVFSLVALNHDLEHPEQGFSGWLCAADSGPCTE
ncbi:hypothetical protein [Streptomyces daliensis]|uniref:Uncharacterized protein n=1 Tax=Streptomyces daliensis TaxID=299421 RepID=A0A8T4IQN7_9ACTN|nr:hypothetical protein [Streptomyces daliensis]